MAVKPKVARQAAGRKGPAPSRREPSGRVVLAGSLTVGRADELRRDLLRALGGGRGSRLSFGEVDRVDLSFLQLLCALHRSAHRAGKELGFGWEDLPPEVKETARSAGFPRHRGCRPGCLWACGE